MNWGSEESLKRGRIWLWMVERFYWQGEHAIGFYGSAKIYYGESATFTCLLHCDVRAYCFYILGS